MKYMIIAGTHLTDNDVAFLVEKLRNSGFADLAGRLGTASALDTMLFHLSTDDREAFVSALDDCPVELRHVKVNLREQLVDQPV